MEEGKGKRGGGGRGKLFMDQSHEALPTLARLQTLHTHTSGRPSRHQCRGSVCSHT